uniref:hypothetical protein n=1 Tax=Shewanella sp. TaxID=50422 RepID=UPI004047211A
MAIKKYIKKQGKKFVKRTAKRYTTRTGGARVNKLATDIYTIKRMLNVEHKHIDYQFGAIDGADAITQYPTKDYPILLALSTPIRGTAYNNRIGNQIRIVHITSKIQFIFLNNQDLTQRVSARAQIVFSKNASDVPDITELYEKDANGHYTPMSMSNTQEFDKFEWIKGHDHKQSHTQPTNRYPLSNSGGRTADPRPGQTPDNIEVDEVATQVLNSAPYYSNLKSKESIKIMFKNLTDEVETMKPYLLLRSDVISQSNNTVLFDPVAVSGIIRLTYVDN